MTERERLAAVFVHGFASSEETWKSFDERLAEDEELAAVDSLHFKYSTRLARKVFWRPDRRLPTLSTIADVLQSFMETEASDYQRIVFVCHSMGGLVVQRYLERMLSQGRGKELARIHRVVLFATPNAGSNFARDLRKELFGNHPQEKDLRTLNEEIRDTHAAVIRDIANAAGVGERTCQIPFSVYAGADDNIVPRASAQGSFPEVGALPGDHFTIIKPTSRHHSSYTTLRRLLLEAAADSDPPGDDYRAVGSVNPIDGHQVPHRKTPSTVIVSELRTDFDGTPWEDVYHEVREELTSASILVVDKWAHPDAAVDVIITVRSTETVMQS
ncbi:alpha/beta fold hydrolase, partial [Streptomyces pseudogriseolus]|uniref:esterase/lipase family protein n=1 Tax=Streptomyces pseudogriseolus TaxID=36817 RepID=UPI00349500A7